MSGPARPSFTRTPTESSRTVVTSLRRANAKPKPESSRPGVTRTSSSGAENFACPFAKNDPIYYSHCNPDSSMEQEYRSCSTGVMRNISRLKQHLSRTHKDEMTEEQQRLVMERISGDHAQGWYNIYQILFPEDPLPASPYAEYVTGEHLRLLMKHVATRLPKMLFGLYCMQELQGRAPPGPFKEDTRFPATQERIWQALARCQQEFGEQQGLGHIFKKGPPPIDLSATTRTASRTRSRPSQDPQMTQSMGTFTAGNSPDEEMSGMSSAEEFDEQLALRTIEDHNVHSVQGRSSYSPVESPIFTPYTATVDTQPRMAYDNSNTFQRR